MGETGHAGNPGSLSESGPRAIGCRDGSQEFDLLKGFSGSLGNGAERILGDMHGETCLLANQPVEPTQ